MIVNKGGLRSRSPNVLVRRTACIAPKSPRREHKKRCKKGFWKGFGRRNTIRRTVARSTLALRCQFTEHALVFLSGDICPD